MKQILVQLDDYTATLLDRVAPGRGRKRSKFIREAVIRALMDVAEEETRRAYERLPDTEAPWAFDPTAWAPERYAIHPTPKEQRVIDRAAKRRARTRRP